MKVRSLSVGPIVGATSTDQVRLFGRAEVEMVGEQPRRCFAVGRVKPKVSGGRWTTTKVVKMNPNFDLSSVLVFEGLTPATGYEYQLGVVYADGEPDSMRLGGLDWAEAHRSSFVTASDDDAATRSIVFGSCRYILRTWMGSFYESRGDKTFRSINRQIDGGLGVDQLLMVGDQIYADDLNFYRPDQHLDQFYARYRESFSQQHIRSLMSRVPTYMTLDDHEIEDNWPEHASSKDWVTKYPVAMHAYITYQASHSPLLRVSDGRLAGVPTQLWYQYRDGCCDVFVTDSRTERRYDLREMLGGDQVNALKEWLADGSGRVKIIVTSVPFFPDPRGQNRDKWSGFPEQRAELLEFITENAVKKVLLLSGDVHCSLSTELISQSEPKTKLISVVSSAFFWPYPHESTRDFSMEGEIDGGRAGKFELVNGGSAFSGDNFTRLTVDPGKVVVDVFERKGNQVSSRTHQF